MPERKTGSFVGLVIIALIALAVLYPYPGEALSAGGTGITGASKRGCTDMGTGCHRTNADPAVTYSVSGVPEKYKPGESYPIAITLGGQANTGVDRQGGFALSASGGKLSAPEGSQDVQVTESGEATHTAKGNNQRQWNLKWTAPEKGDVYFYGAVNTVNGNGANDQGDLWNTFVTVSQGEKAEEEEGAKEAKSFGVPILAHWIGIVSMVATFLIIVIAFFLLKYGESRKTVDQSDRKK
ncbi:MAG: hypothetical protein HY555_05005 [Euryarchaeota archaeon]|nr:hypothetical protein [Euryarchaeota archaeon]